MPLLKLFGIIENFLGFAGNEQEYHYRSDHSARKSSESTDICVSHVNKNASHASTPLADFSIVSLLFTFSFFRTLND